MLYKKKADAQKSFGHYSRVWNLALSRSHGGLSTYTQSIYDSQTHCLFPGIIFTNLFLNLKIYFTLSRYHHKFYWCYVGLVSILNLIFFNAKLKGSWQITTCLNERCVYRSETRIYFIFIVFKKNIQLLKWIAYRHLLINLCFILTGNIFYISTSICLYLHLSLYIYISHIILCLHFQIIHIFSYKTILSLNISIFRKRFPTVRFYKCSLFY